MHAILGASDSCIATHPSDMAVPMAALEAQIELLEPNQSTRRVPIDDFYSRPGSTPHIETVLRTGEMITAVILPPPPAGGQRYRKVRDRASYEFALISVAVIIATERETITTARVAFGGVAHKPWRSIEAEATLKGRPAMLTTYQAAADAALRSAVGHGHNEFKIELTKRTLCRTLADAAQISIGRQS
jgi:xanthine dehydrogenase YagS FAD-binding subunit